MGEDSRLRGLAMRLVDRHSERGVLDHLINAVREGGSRVLVVRGEPGVGKSALLDYLAGHAPTCRVVRATGVESEIELAGMFDDHHGELAQLELDQIAFLDARIAQVETSAAGVLAQIPAYWGTDATGETGPHAGAGPDAAVLPAAERLAEIPGISINLAISIIAETGLDMTRFPTPGHLVSRAGLCPRVRQSGPRTRKGGKKHGDAYLRCDLGQAATAASHTDTFLAERYYRVARRRGKAIAQAAVARSILVIIWHLLADPGTRFRDLGPGYYASRTGKDKKIRSHAEVSRFFAGLRLLEPGVVRIPDWRPSSPAESVSPANMRGGVAIKD
jgi:transposase